MIHDVTIPFSFDTSPIEQQIAKIGQREVANAINAIVKEGILSAMPKKSCYSYTSEKPKTFDEIEWGRVVIDRLNAFFESHSEEIIDEAALILAKRASRKKSWRETLDELKEELNEL